MKILKNILQKLITFTKKYPEVLAIPIGLILWKLSVYFLRFIDPTSATYDAGIFQKFIYAVIGLFIFTSISWLALKVLFGTMRTYLQKDMKNDFMNLTGWQKMELCYGIFFALVLILVYLSKN